MKSFYWLVKREYWEHRGGFLWAPIIAAATFLVSNLLAIGVGAITSHRFNFTIGNQNVERVIRQLQDQGVDASSALNTLLYAGAVIPGIVLIFVVFFYCLGALYDDRRDRSILLWKSLPVSDRDTVLSKVFSAAVTAPVIVLVIGILTAYATLLMTAITASMYGINVWPLLAQASPFKVAVNMLALIPVNFVWALPTLGWLLLCSAWARSKPFLWAVAIPVVAGILVSWLSLVGTPGLSAHWFWSNVTKRLLLGVVPMGWLDKSTALSGNTESLQGLLASLSPGHAWAQLLHTSYWLGALAGCAMIAAAIWMRSWRSEV